MASPIGKVTLEDLERFLQQNGELWGVAAPPAIAAAIGRSPVAANELIDALGLYRPELGYVYVFSDEEDPYNAVNQHWPNNVDSVDAEGLERFVIRTVRGRDFLYVAPSDEDASNGEYITLLTREWDETDVER
ncbi:MAG TPA: hypothetical protein VMV10_23905 [Pirellulales bacterium]|nr:hypothetical protein [Pirellulales bacterium]